MGLFSKIFSRGKAEDKYAIALDIGTEFVKALIFKVAEGKGEVTGVGRQRQGQAHMQAGAVTDIEGVIRNCRSALEEAANQAQILPEQVVIGIAGELVKGTTSTIRYLRPEAKKQIDLAELKDIISRVQRRSFDRARSLLAWETGHSEIDVRLVNAAIVDVKIDGYKVTNPIGFQGKEVEVGVFNAFAPIVHLGALQTIAASLELDLLSIAAEPYAVSRCLGPEEGTDFSAIFIDVGGGTTDIAVVRRGGVEGTKMFALGGRAFTKRISQILGETFRQAEEDKLKYSAGELDHYKANLIRQAVVEDSQVWFAGVELALGEFSHIDLLPSRILLCGGGSNLPEIPEILKKGSWSKSLPFARRPAVHFLHPKDVVNIVDKTGELKDAADVTPMALANIALELVGEETVVEGILSRVVGGLRT